MQIGEVAELLGVTTRTVRHYHRMGVVPEPARLPNGYRSYGLRDAVVLMRAVRLAGLGMSLDEVSDSLRDDSARDLAEILGELDTDLAAQELRIRQRRETIAQLRTAATAADTNKDRAAEAGRDAGAGHGSAATTWNGGADPLVPAEARALFNTLAAGGVTGHSLELDRGILSVIPDDGVKEWARMMAPLTDNPAAVAQLANVYARLDELGSVEVLDTAAEVDALAREMLSILPTEVREAFASAPSDSHPLLDAITDDLAPAQAAVIRRIIDLRLSP